MGWAKYEEDNYEALTDRWTSGNLICFPPLHSETARSIYIEQTYRQKCTTDKEMEIQNEANIV